MPLSPESLTVTSEPLKAPALPSWNCGLPLHPDEDPRWTLGAVGRAVGMVICPPQGDFSLRYGI